MITEFFFGTWHWFISGSAIAAVMLLLVFTGRQFGVSSNLRTLCSAAGAGNLSSFFRFEWKDQLWNLTFVAGSILGGFLSSTFLMANQESEISRNSIEHLDALGLGYSKTSEMLTPLFPEAFVNPSLPLIFLLLLGGALVGFGARYAGGCTSGHAISGLSNFQLPSLIAVVGFFIGGLVMTWLILPQIFG